MNLTVPIPDDLAQRLGATGDDLSRRALEALAAEEYKHERITKPELQRLLGIETSFQLDEFLKAHDVLIEDVRGNTEGQSNSLAVFEKGLGLFGSPEDAALLDEIVSIAYEDRRRPGRPVPAL
jgi:hypothetical protein